MLLKDLLESAGNETFYFVEENMLFKLNKDGCKGIFKGKKCMPRFIDMRDEK